MKTFIPIEGFQDDSVINFSFEITQQCNFRCAYCCFSGDYAKMRKHSSLSMTLDTVSDAVEFLKKHAQRTDTIYLSFFGGEALLHRELVDYAIRSLRLHYGDRIYFDLSTNGYLLDDKTVDWICSYDKFGVSVSLDGNQHVHDRNRTTVSGKPTFRTVHRNLRRFKERYPDEYNERIRLLMTLGSLSDIRLIAEDWEEIKFLSGVKPVFINHIKPDYDHGLLYRDTLAEKQAFYDQALRYKLVGTDNLYTFLLDELISKLDDPKEFPDTAEIPTGTCLNTMTTMFISADGRVYACEKFAQNHYVGDIWNGIINKRLRILISATIQRRNKLCTSCKYLPYCRRCPADLKETDAQTMAYCEDFIENIDLALYYKSQLKCRL